MTEEKDSVIQVTPSETEGAQKFSVGFYVGTKILYVELSEMTLLSAIATAETVFLLSIPRISAFEIYKPGDREAGKPPLMRAMPFKVLGAIGPKLNELALQENVLGSGLGIVTPVIRAPKGSDFADLLRKGKG